MEASEDEQASVLFLAQTTVNKGAEGSCKGIEGRKNMVSLPETPSALLRPGASLPYVEGQILQLLDSI